VTNPSEFATRLRPGLGQGKLLATRRGTIAAALLAALAAMGVLLLFMSNYRDSVQSEATEVKVLVADGFIDKGTSGDAIAEAGLFRPETIGAQDTLDGAISDPSELKGKVVTDEVYRGQQLTDDDLAAGADPITGKLAGTQRALSVPVDVAKGNVDQIEPGSHVDVLASYGTQLGTGRATTGVDVLARDILVLHVGDTSGSSVGSDDKKAVVLRVTDIEASRIVYGAEDGDVWLTLRPPTLGEDSDAGQVDYSRTNPMTLLGG
jgi:Flp pilus assembly protein CpaB